MESYTPPSPLVPPAPSVYACYRFTAKLRTDSDVLDTA
jgi:hypothetical protein